MRYLYYCNSAYQILTVMNLHWHRKYAAFEDIEDYDADIIILNSFPQAKDMSDIIRNSGLFGKVWLVNRAFNSGRFHSLNTLTDFLKPDLYLRNNFGIKKKEVYNRYSSLCVPKYSTITAAIWRLNKKAELTVFEDGVGAYIGSINMDPDSRLYKKFYKTFNHGKDFHDFRKFYVNAAELFSGIAGHEVIDIPTFDEEFLCKIRELFAEYMDIDDLENKNIYYFAQFLNNRETIMFIDDLLDNMVRYGKQVVYIPHPRHKDARTYSFAYAKEKQSWELRLSNIDDIDRKLLISIHSTACFTPKILFDKEPYVLLFYDLCDDKVTARNESFDRFMELFADTYRDRTKIMAPKTRDEFFECIEYYLSREGLSI